MCLRHDVADLKAALPSLPAGRIDFASSLIAQFEKGKKPLSDKQVYWVQKLAKEAFTPKAAPATVAVANFASVNAVFAKAAEHLKQPKVRLALPTGQKVVLSLAPAHGNNPGFIYLKVAGEYAGKIAPTGAFTPYKLAADVLDAVKALFVMLGDDPAAVAAAYGKETGSCCFCAKELSKAESLFVGYGPDCADHYGLPWGETRH
jgi:hypothetical protein